MPQKQTHSQNPNLEFDLIPEVIDKPSSIDRPQHEPQAISLTIIDPAEKFWNRHPAQEDNLLILHSKRFLKLYSKQHSNLRTNNHFLKFSACKK